MSDLANVRRGRDFTAYFRFGRRAGARRGEQEKPLPLGRQLLLQAILLFITATVLFPIFWMASMMVKPNDAMFHYNAALTLERLGRTQDAVEHLKSALRAEPTNDAARRALARLSPGSGE